MIGNAHEPPVLSIVVPTYNERDDLSSLVETVVAVFEHAGLPGEIVVVDDNSPDGTGQLAEELATRHPLRVVHRAGKLGLGTAVIDGFHAAAAEIVGVMDGDRSHPAALLPAMFAVMQATGSDMVVGSRYVPGGGSTNWPVARLAMSRLACLLARPVTPVRDASSGFFLVRRSAIAGVSIAAGGFKICLELLVRGRIRTVVEVPYVFAGRTAGTSKMNVREATGYLLQLVQLLRVRIDSNAAPRPRYLRVSGPELRGMAAGQRLS